MYSEPDIYLPELLWNACCWQIESRKRSDLSAGIAMECLLLADRIKRMISSICWNCYGMLIVGR